MVWNCEIFQSLHYCPEMILADSVTNDPNVLVSKCLDLVNEGKSLPAGFQCWPNTDGSMVIPAGK